MDSLLLFFTFIVLKSISLEGDSCIMRPKFEQLNSKITNQSFLCYEVKVAAFEFLWHYHPEYELTYILEGKGKRLVGDSYENFKEGDWVLLPPMLPHTWVSEHTATMQSRAIVIQFSKQFIEHLFYFKELKDIEKFFEKADSGLQFLQGTVHASVVELLQAINLNNGLPCFTYLLQVLKFASTIPCRNISSIQYKPIKGKESQIRINTVFQYVQNEFRNNISISKAAKQIHLSQSAFCKFFKRTSGKTFSDYVNDIRIAHACYLLIETDKPINLIAVESGFESLTYFNRVFLKKKKLKPREYRKVLYKK
ncbi:MAG: hypothetical protein C0459_04345 [Chitinophaga sp.]|jgi:AraC-like DNA-binding protein|nr:hypothetical protein [Chitinophaga sp.]